MGDPSDRAAARRLRRLQQYARLASGVQCRAPQFLIVGAQKGGTTSLYSYLTQHPDVFPATRKEVHFFEDPVSRAKGERWYRSFFPTEISLRARERKRDTALLTGEATTYLPFPRIPRMLSAVNPDARLILLLRNPIERAFSHYKHVRRSYPGVEVRTFGEAIRSEPRRTPFTPASPGQTDPNDDPTYRVLSYVRSGRYGEQLGWWLDAFPREHLYIDESERFFSQPNEVLAGISEFLDLSPHEFDTTEQLNVGGYDDHIEPADRAFLVNAFEDDRAKLQAVLGPDFGSSWF